MYTWLMAKSTPAAQPDSVEVGVRALRADLSRWLEVARERDVVITERGRPVARIVAIGERPGLERLIAEGSVVMPERAATRLDTSSLVPSRASVSDLIADQRR